MRQALHIFRKDARHCGPYIAAVLAMTAVHAWLACRDTVPSPSSVKPLFLILMPLAWWFVTAAAVHGESLAGDRQFWVTRPYSWRSLLAAKVLFLAAFGGLPVLLSDCVTLLANGFNPLALIPGLLLRQCWLAAVLALPFGVASLTRTLREFLLAGVAFFVCLVLEAQLLASPLRAMAAEPEWLRDGAPWLLPVTAVALAVWHYARRRTTLARVLAFALVPWTPFLTVPSLARNTHTIASYDPKFRNVTIQFDPGRGHRFPGGSEDRIFIPVMIGGWPKDLVACRPLGGASFDRSQYCDTSGADGSAWLVLTPAPWLPEEGDLALPLDLDVYEQAGSSVSVPADGEWVRIPGFGGVRLVEGAMQRSLIARTPLTPAGPEWSFRLGVRTEDYLWGPLSGDTAPEFPNPFAFRMGSVGYRQSWVYPRGALPPPLVFTAVRLAAVLHRELKIPHFRLWDYEVRKP
jgi:hypothetical protein